MERSKYAEYFEKAPQGTTAQCKLCVATIALSSRSGTSGMRRHLMRHHNNEYQEMLVMESKMESGSRKRERESSAPEEDSFAKQMRMIENLVYNCSQMTDDSMVQGEVENVFDEKKEEAEEYPLNFILKAGLPSSSLQESRIEEHHQLNHIVTQDYTPIPSAPNNCVILPNISPGCSTSCRTTVHKLQMSLLQKMNQISEAETKASSSSDREILAETVAEGAETRANILEAELKAKDELLMKFQEELKARDILLEEERMRHAELLMEAKRSHAEKDKAVRMRMEVMVQKKEELSMQLCTQQAETRTMKFENERTINELQSKVDDLAARLKKYEDEKKINGFRGLRPVKEE